MAFFSDLYHISSFFPDKKKVSSYIFSSYTKIKYLLTFKSYIFMCYYIHIYLYIYRYIYIYKESERDKEN